MTTTNNTTATTTATTTPIADIKVSYSKHLGNRHTNEQIMTDNCGTCDGALCDHCTKTFTVMGKRFCDFESAEKFASGAAADLIELTGSVEIAESVLDLVFYLNSDNLLCVKWWSWEKSDHAVICNTAAKLYPEKMALAVENRANWESCPCVDKHGASCSVVGCDDSLCRHQVLHCGRKEKKWYM